MSLDEHLRRDEKHRDMLKRLPSLHEKLSDGVDHAIDAKSTADADAALDAASKMN